MMKKFYIYILSIMLSIGAAQAGPPPGGYPKQVPVLIFCHKDEALMLKAIERTFHEHIFAAGTTGGGILYFTRDPDDGSFSVVGTMNNETCVIFNGENLEDFDEPPYIRKEGDEDA